MPTASHEFHGDFKGFFSRSRRGGSRFSGTRRLPAREWRVVALSDHGFGPIRSEVYLNPGAEKIRLFLPGGPGAKGLPGISGRATAFALDPSRLYVHRQGKYPRGAVAAVDYEKVRGDLKDLFSGYEVGGRKAVRRVYMKEELYSGAQMAGGARPGAALRTRL